MRITARLLATLLCVFVLLGLAMEPVSQITAAPGPRLTAPADDNISSLSAPQWQSAARQWTAAEMENAQPYPLPDPGKLEAALTQLSAKDFENLTPGTIPGGLPEGEKNSLTVPGMDMLSFGSAPSGYTYPAPFTRYTNIIKYEKSYPEKTIGKLFFYQRGFAYVCSAASIGNYAIWTAGHCVHDGSNSFDGWSYNVVFAPGYPASKKTGQWAASYLVTKTAWYQNEDLGQDMGGAILYTRKSKRISDKVGYLGFAYNYPVEQHWFSIGYPSQSPFTGSLQVVCASSYAYSDPAFTPNPVGVGCDQTPGTSGGPWIMAYGSGYYLNGNMSYRYSNHPLEMFSPYFGDSAYSLWVTLINDVP